jgi:MFS family permease
MWELYALWAWLPAFIVAAQPLGRLRTGLIAFAAIGVAGLAGSVLGGFVADRVGRATTTSAAMIVSATCCLVSPLAFGAGTSLLVALVLVWGAAVIADSAQFSAATTELAEPAYAGSALTLQLALGFALTVASIRLVPVLAEVVGWRFALLPLAAGPLAGTVAMQLLHAHPKQRLSPNVGSRRIVNEAERGLLGTDDLDHEADTVGAATWKGTLRVLEQDRVHASAALVVAPRFVEYRLDGPRQATEAANPSSAGSCRSSVRARAPAG